MLSPSHPDLLFSIQLKIKCNPVHQNGPGELFDGFKNCVGSKVCVTGPNEMCTNKMKDDLRRSITTIILEEFVKAEMTKKAPNMRTVLGKITDETGVTDHDVHILFAVSPPLHFG